MDSLPRPDADAIKAPRRHVRTLVLSNFKKFESLKICFDPDLNVLVGDNEAGKSTILQAIDLVLSGSRSKVEGIGIDTLLNKAVVDRYLQSDKAAKNLPTLFVEVYLSGPFDVDVHGRCNSAHEQTLGLRFVCEPDETYGKEIAQVLSEPGDNFPFEFYAIRFLTFAGQPYGGYRRHVGHLLIDSASINTDHAHREYTRRLYQANATSSERGSHQNKYRSAKREFWTEHLSDLNESLEVKFWLRSSSKASLENDLLLVKDSIPIESKGRGQQSLIKTEFALQRGRGKDGIDVLMLEEPENHLSHGNMLALVAGISSGEGIVALVATLCLVFTVAFIPARFGNHIGERLASTDAKDFREGCERSKASCVMLRKDGKDIASGYVLDSSPSHIAVFDIELQRSRSLPREGLETLSMRAVH